MIAATEDSPRGGPAMSHSLTIGSNRKTILSPAAIESLDKPRFFTLVCGTRSQATKILDS
jgi:hypothetical protein